jgi:uncharacterized protein (TIGR04255 family)
VYLPNVKTGAENPLTGPSPKEVPLHNAPLVRVIGQARFPLIAALGQQDSIAPFQAAIGTEYPVLRREQTQGLVIGPVGIAQSPQQIAWRFHSRDEHWRVSVAADFIALETTEYVSRKDFLRRLEAVLQAADLHIKPSQIDRLGLRYIDRITGDALTDIGSLVRPEIRGITGSEVSGHIQHALSEAIFNLAENQIAARWGHLPPNATVDPAAVEPVAVASWILDLDMFSTVPFPFEVENTLEKAGDFAERIYALFRWAVTEEFLIRYGGEV